MGGGVGGRGCWWVGSGGLTELLNGLSLERVKVEASLGVGKRLVGEAVGCTPPGGILDGCIST